MRVGSVSKWFATGQAVVSRQIRSALDELGHETFVLAKQGKGPRRAAGAGRRPGLGPARGHARSEADIPLDEYRGLGRRQRARGRAHRPERPVRRDRGAARRAACGRSAASSGRASPPEDAEPAKAAYDVIYSFTRAEQERYRGFGIESPLLTWGCHPELVALARAGRGRPRAPTTSCASRARLASWASASRSPRSSRRSRGPRRPPAASDPRPGRPQGAASSRRRPAATSAS